MIWGGAPSTLVIEASAAVAPIAAGAVPFDPWPAAAPLLMYVAPAYGLLPAVGLAALLPAPGGAVFVPYNPWPLAAPVLAQ